jgi:hypothetical protein
MLRFAYGVEHCVEIRFHLVVPVKDVCAPGVLVEDHSNALGRGGLGVNRARRIGWHLLLFRRVPASGTVSDIVVDEANRPPGETVSSRYRGALTRAEEVPHDVNRHDEHERGRDRV